MPIYRLYIYSLQRAPNIVYLISVDHRFTPTTPHFVAGHDIGPAMLRPMARKAPLISEPTSM